MAKTKRFKSRLKSNLTARTGASNKARGKAGAIGGAKAIAIIELVIRASGATLAELMDATGWQAHSVRAALTKARKNGLVHEVSSVKDESGTRRYFAVRHGGASPVGDA